MKILIWITICIINAQTTLWQKFQEKNIDLLNVCKDLPTRIFYKIFLLKEGILLDSEEIDDILNYPIVPKIFRKTIEERIMMMKDGEKKYKIIFKYITNNRHYGLKILSRDMKLFWISKYYRSSNLLLHHECYQLADEFFNEIIYETKGIPKKILYSLAINYKINKGKFFLQHILMKDFDLIDYFSEICHHTDIKKYNQKIKNLIKNNSINTFDTLTDFIIYICLHHDNYTIDYKHLLILIKKNGHLLKEHKEVSKILLKAFIKKIIYLIPFCIYDDDKDVLLLFDFVEILESKSDFYHRVLFYKGIYYFYHQDYNKALKCFNEAFEIVKSTNAFKYISKYSFWIANTYKSLSHHSKSISYYKLAEKFNVTYYSSMSDVFVQKDFIVKSIYDLTIEQDSIYDWLFRAIDLTSSGDDFIMSLNLIRSLTPSTIMVISKTFIKMLRHLDKNKNKTYIVLLGYEIYQFTGVILWESFPFIDEIKNYSLNMQILMSSIIKNESFFRNEKLISKKNATGIMQINPTTAKTFCERLKIPFRQNYLHREDFNIFMGYVCLKEMIKIFKGSLFYTIIAYNLGTKKALNLRRNLTKLDKNNILHMFCLVEMIADPDVREYVKDVLDQIVIFCKIKLKQHPTEEFFVNFHI